MCSIFFLSGVPPFSVLTARNYLLLLLLLLLLLCLSLQRSAMGEAPATPPLPPKLLMVRVLLMVLAFEQLSANNSLY